MERQRGVTLRFLAEPGDVNFGGKVMGGAVMKWIDQAGYTCAAGWTGSYCVTVYVGGLHFLGPIHVGEVVECQRSFNNPHLWSLKIPHPPHPGGHRHERHIVEGHDAGRARDWPRGHTTREGRMVREDCWREVHRLFHVERRSKSEIARQLALDRKTVRGILHGAAWQPYTRAERTDTLLAEHASYLQTRAPQVQYSARILFQELRQGRGYRGSYETVKRFMRPLRAVEQAAERATVRFETPPGQQSQIDWGQARIAFRSRPVVLHVFILTLGYSRRSFHEPCLGETLSQFLDAHERAFDYFGGHTREHLYDRPRTVCQPGGDGRVVWNATFKQFADYWGFEPHLCRAYRAQTKSYVAHCTSLGIVST